LGSKVSAKNRRYNNNLHHVKIPRIQGIEFASKGTYMSGKIKILGISGSLRKQSFNTSTLRAAQALTPEDATIEVFDIAGIPIYNQDEEANPPRRVTEFKKAIREADAILFVTPEYNYSIPGPLKNAIDWASRPYGDSAWNGKPVAVMSASVGIQGGIRAQYHVRQLLVALNMPAVTQPEVAIPAAHEKFDANGNLTDENSRKLVSQLLQNLVTHTRVLSGEGAKEKGHTA
jgi:chromate reductase